MTAGKNIKSGLKIKSGLLDGALRRFHDGNDSFALIHLGSTVVRLH